MLFSFVIVSSKYSSHEICHGQGKWQRLQIGRILRVPVPAAMTPQVNMAAQITGTECYKVSTKRDPLRLRSGTGTKYKVLGKYKKGTERYCQELCAK